MADHKRRPVMRLLFTTEQVPFTDQQPWLEPVTLERSFDLWRSSEQGSPGWALSLDRWPRQDERNVVTLAARRKDATREPGGNESDESNWHLTQTFGSLQATLATRFAIGALLAIYSDSLSDLRDRAGIKRRLRRPIREARELDRYLIRDGLDAATITADVRALTEDARRFNRDVPEYEEDLGCYPPDRRKNQDVRDLLPVLRKSLRAQTARLVEDTAATIGNIRASAELRQAMANTRLQRTILVLSIVATVVALISLTVAIN